MKKKKIVKKIGIVLTGTILSIATAGVILPASITAVASIAGAVGTSLIAVDSKLDEIK
jgi:hypothetical protein